MTLSFERASRAQDGKLVVVIRLANYTPAPIVPQLDMAGYLRSTQRNEFRLFPGSGFESLGSDGTGSRRVELGPGQILRGQISFDAPVAAYSFSVHLPPSNPSIAFSCILPRI
jgi:hypothetical protein